MQKFVDIFLFFSLYLRPYAMKLVSYHVVKEVRYSWAAHIMVLVLRYSLFYLFF